MLSVQPILVTRDARLNQELEKTKVLAVLLALQVEKAACGGGAPLGCQTTLGMGVGMPMRRMTRMAVRMSIPMGRMPGLRHYCRCDLRQASPGFCYVLFLFFLSGWIAGVGCYSVTALLLVQFHPLIVNHSSPPKPAKNNE